MLDEQVIQNMLTLARQARERAYTPYSHFRVGACLMDVNGRFHLGCNIENAAFTPTNCAERTALFKAVSEGVREFSAIAIVWDGDAKAVPCGVCRQALSEFCPPDMPIICGDNTGDYDVYTLSALLPAAFGQKDMK